MKSPVVSVGGKFRLVDKILPLIPSHEIYVEVFGGAGWLLFKKPPSKVEIYNDIDSNLVNLFRVIRDPQKFEKFYEQVRLTLYSREEFEYYKNLEPRDDIEKAVRTFILIRQSFNAKKGHWGYGTAKNCAHPKSYFAAVEEIPLIHRRLRNVYIENNDFRKVIRRYDSENTFFYCDPPYILETRRCVMYRDFEMSLDDHKDLVQLLLDIKGTAILSCYYHPIYDPLIEAGWIRKDFEVLCNAVGKAGKIKGKGALQNHKRVETLLIKPKKDYNLFSNLG